MEIKLENKRLLACADLIEEQGGNKIAADIGTDHGLLAIYLISRGICERVRAADINALPLESARRNITACGLADKVELYLSDGADRIPPEGITHIICAGMGGELIIDILSRCKWAKDCTLILQPMTKSDRLRKWLFDEGYFVERERAVRDGRFVYSVMRAVYSPEKINYECDNIYLAVGRVKPFEYDGKAYYELTAGRLKSAAQGMLKSADKQQQGREFDYLADRLIKITEEIS